MVYRLTNKHKMVQQYKKLPVTIQAIQLTSTNCSEVEEFVGKSCKKHYSNSSPDIDTPYTGLRIETLEGVMLASVGDYVIKGIKGEFYPCKPDIFEGSYDLYSSGQDNEVSQENAQGHDLSHLAPTSSLSFGAALDYIKKGAMVVREGWNGKGMFIFMRPADEINVSTVVRNIKSLPDSVKDYYREKDAQEAPSEQGLNNVKFTAYLCMKAADGTIVNGWLASQTDLLAEDWCVVN